MFVSPAIGAALDRIADRVADVRRAFEPGAVPRADDVARSPASSFTLDPLSVAAPAQAYFLVDNRRGRTEYVRDGSFHLANDTLVDATGAPVLGRRTAGAPLTPLALDPVDVALGRVRDARIEPDGTLAYSRATIDPRANARSFQTIAVGRVAVARFPAASRLETSADGRAGTAPEGVAPHVGLPGDGTFAALLPMQRTGSGVNLDESLARLKAAYVAFDALAAAETARDRFGKTAMDVVK